MEKTESVKLLEDERRELARRTQSELGETNAAHEGADTQALQQMFSRMLGLLREQRLVDYSKVRSCFSPGDFGDGIYVGSFEHAKSVEALQQLGITAVINCAPGVCDNPPKDKYVAAGITYLEVRLLVRVAEGRDGLHPLRLHAD
jgi:hypothetical protein